MCNFMIIDELFTSSPESLLKIASFHGALKSFLNNLSWLKIIQICFSFPRGVKWSCYPREDWGKSSVVDLNEWGMPRDKGA